MSINVADRGRFIASFRFVEVRLMETAAAWIPSTPEMEAKLLLGEHVWYFAQHADALGKRAFELRLPLHHTLAPAPEYVGILDEVRRLERTGERLAVLYEALIPGLERRYQSYLQSTDGLLDAPSVVVLERALGDLSRQRKEADGLRALLERPSAVASDVARREQASAFLAASGGA